MIILTTLEQTKNPNTKTTYITENKTIELISKKEHSNITSLDTQKFFRRLGGKESATYSYTSEGYLCTKLISTSPDRQIKKIREFNIIHFPYAQQQIFDKLFVSMNNEGLIKLKRFKRLLTIQQVKQVLRSKLK